MKIRLVIGLLCGTVTVAIQLYFRPIWRDHDKLSSVLLGSLPNFLAVLGLALILLAFRRPDQRPSSTILAALVGVLAHEIFTGSTPNSSFGGHFDWNDIIASVLGAVAAYFIEQSLRRAESTIT